MTSGSSASFNRAVKHLFRHLDQPLMLRENPLVRHFFEGYPASLGHAYQDRAVLAHIYELIHSAAARCRDEDIAAGKPGTALRRHAILTQCLQRRPIREVAATLGISHQHCYRERANICVRVMRDLCGRGRRVAPQCRPLPDEFQLRLDYLCYHSSFPNMNTALRICDDLIKAAPSPKERIDALCVAGSVVLELGNLKWALDAYALARRTLDEPFGELSDDSRAIAKARLDLFGSTLAFYRADGAGAFRLVQEASMRLETLHTADSETVRHMHAECLLNLGSALWNSGSTELGLDCIVRAHAKLTQVPAGPLALRIRATSSLWKLRNCLVLSGRAWYPSQQRLDGLLAAVHDALTYDFIPEALHALVAILEHYAFSGNDDEALRAARLAVLLAGRQSATADLRDRIEIAVRLLPTRHWTYGASLLPKGHRAEGIDAYHRNLLSYYSAHRLLKLGRFQDALTLATTPDEDRLSATLAVRKQVVAAAAAHALERPKVAREYVESVIPAAERLRSAPILREAYGVAGTVTGNPKLVQRAVEVLQLLRA